MGQFSGTAVSLYDMLFDNSVTDDQTNEAAAAVSQLKQEWSS